MEKPVAAADILLNRFLYISETECAYVPGNLFVHQYKKNQETVFDLVLQLQNGGKHNLIEEIFEKYLRSNFVPNNDNAIYVLALCCRRGDMKTSSICYKFVSRICKTPEDLMLFVKFMCTDFVDTNKKGFGRGMRKALAAWYLSREPLELAKIVGFCKSKHGRSHKDILSLSHVKSEDGNINAILTYAVSGYAATKKKFEVVEGFLEQPFFKLLTDLNEFKLCDDPQKACKFIEIYHFPVTLTPTHLMKSRQVWEAAVNIFSLKETMHYLHRLQNLGFLNPSNVHSKKILPKVLSYLKDKALMQRAKLHPLQAYILLRNYESGGKPYKFPKCEFKKKALESPDAKPIDPPNTAIINALKGMVDATMTMHNDIGARFMVTLDMRSQMFEAKCCQNPNISPGMAAIVMALALARRERECTVAVFTERGVQPVGLKDCSLQVAVDKLKNIKAGNVRMHKPIEWCISKKKQIDVFINIMECPSRLASTSSEESKERKCVIQELVKYRSKMNIPNCKLVSMFLARHNPAVGRNYINCIDFGGLDENIPKIVEHFAKDHFK